MSTPTITDASIRSNGRFLDVVFDVPVTSSHIQQAGETTVYALNPVVKVGSKEIGANFVTSSLTATFELSETIYSGDIVHVTFEDSRLNNGNDRLADSEGEVDNKSTQVRARQGCMTEKKGDFSNREFNRLHPDRIRFNFDRHG